MNNSLILNSKIRNEGNLSNRGILGKEPIRDDLGRIFEALEDAYDRESNPNGYLVMLVAENKLKKEMIVEKIDSCRADDEWACVGYCDSKGVSSFRKSMAEFMERSYMKVPVDPNKILIAAGCGSIIDLLCWCLGESGDGCIVPAPYYPAFDSDFFARSRCKVIPAPCEHSEYKITEKVLEEAYLQALEKNITPRILLITNPNNPTGQIISRETIELCISWVKSKNIHIVFDEIYANTIFSMNKYESAARICFENCSMNNKSSYLGEDVHIVYGLSKDFGLSGLRIGCLFSHNTFLLDAMSNLAVFSGVSTQTQSSIQKLLSDKEWVDDYIKQSNMKLAQVYDALTKVLHSIAVPYVPADATLFLWADFRKYLNENTWEAEQQLCEELHHISKISFTTGNSCKSPVPGFFRICFAFHDVHAINELGKRLRSHFQLNNN